MLESKTDKKNRELSKLLYQLREDIDVERIIGLNHDECEKLYTFAVEFYNVIHSGPATIPRGAGGGLVKVMKSMGVQNPKADFEVDH